MYKSDRDYCIIMARFYSVACTRNDKDTLRGACSRVVDVHQESIIDGVFLLLLRTAGALRRNAGAATGRRQLGDKEARRCGRPGRRPRYVRAICGR